MSWLKFVAIISHRPLEKKKKKKRGKRERERKKRGQGGRKRDTDIQCLKVISGS